MIYRNTSKTRAKLQLNSCWDAECNSRFRLVRTHSIQGQRKDKDSSCYLHHQEGLEHIFHTARKLSTDYSSERQPNCSTRRGQCENWTSSGGDHISNKTSTSEHRCGTFTSRWSSCSHIICRAPTTRKLRALTNINKKQKTNRQIWRIYAHKVVEKRREDVMVLKKHQETLKFSLFSLLKFQRKKEELTWRTFLLCR